MVACLLKVVAFANGTAETISNAHHRQAERPLLLRVMSLFLKLQISNLGKVESPKRLFTMLKKGITLDAVCHCAGAMSAKKKNDPSEIS
jgi:hypothetical protein